MAEVPDAMAKSSTRATSPAGAPPNSGPGTREIGRQAAMSRLRPRLQTRIILRFAQARALGRKASDEFTVPLCRGHHREVHRCGDEPAWWQTAGLIRWSGSGPVAPNASAGDGSR